MKINASIHRFLFSHVDNSPLIVFRIFFGLLVITECAGAMLTGWVEEVLVVPQHPLTFIGFEWLSIFTGETAYVYYTLMALAGVMIMLGYYYRIAAGVFAFMWWGCYLMQKTHYNNHYYLMILLAFFMLLVPAHQYYSVDVKRKFTAESLTCPRWCILIFIFQLWVVFTYAALAKISPDWLAGKPMTIWFERKTDYPLIGFLFKYDWLKWVVVYGGIVFDLLIVPLLLWKRTRTAAFFLLIFFNLFNSLVFQIGTFPYLVLAFSVFFFPAEKVRKLFIKRKPEANTQYVIPNAFTPTQRLMIAVLLLYGLFQIGLPLRHLLYKGDVAWTEEGHRMAWHMMLRTKSGHIHFVVKNSATGENIPVRLEDYFTRQQINEMAKKPDMIWQGAQIIKNIYAEKGIPAPEVYAHSKISLNGRAQVPLVNANVNLAAVPWESFAHAEWIMPFKEKSKRVKLSYIFPEDTKPI